MIDVFLICLIAILPFWFWVFVVCKYFPSLRLNEPFRKGTTVSRGDTITVGDKKYTPTGTFTYGGEDIASHPYLEEIDEA